VCCSEMECVAVCCSWIRATARALWCVGVCCSDVVVAVMLQWRCSVLQCVGGVF